jgi:hypothetical protein
MNPERQQTIDYIRAAAGGLWSWTENGSVLVWRDGSTIAFREEIVQIVECLAPQGLPPFGAIVLLLAACKNKIPNLADFINEPSATLPPKMGGDAVVLLAARRQLATKLEAALVQFEKLAKCPAELVSGSKAKCVLAEAVFEIAAKEAHVNAKTILTGLREPFLDANLSGPGPVDIRGLYLRQIHIVAEGLNLHSTESLSLRLKTGLDALPEPVEETLPMAERARRLIQELSRDRELGVLARAARELMAAVRLPRRLGEREQLAIGGVSDITNRGSLDRLLLSEMAHDDLTLSVRVALNEALYLRREPPTHEPPGALALLLDSGVRLWGIPRVLATAVALALVARDKQHSEIFSWRAHGNQLLPVDLLSGSGLTRHLGALETTAHPGAAVAAFVKAIATGAENQSVVITHRDALADPEFRRALAGIPEGPGFIAVVDNAGRFELHALPLARRQPICEADINLTAVFAESPRVPLIKTDVGRDLPAIFGLSPFPFLLPLHGRVDHWIKADDGYNYALMNDRRLVQFRDSRSGGSILATDLPVGKPIWMGCIHDTVHLVKAGASQRPTRLISFPLPDGPVRVTDLVNGADLLAIHQCGDVILTIRTHDVRAHALDDGRLLATVRNPYRWIHGRFFGGDQQFHFAVWDGERVKFEPLTLHEPFSTSLILLVFDRSGIEGPWLIHKQGLIISSATGEQQKLPIPPGRNGPFDSVRVSRDGHRLYVSVASPEWGIFKDLESGDVRHKVPSKSTKLNLDAPPRLPTWNLYQSIGSIAVLNDGIALRGRKQRWRKITLSQTDSIHMVDLPAGSELRQTVEFNPKAKSTQYGCSLQLAEWPNGSRAWLDSRGLLHLKSHDVSVAEISLVLSDGEMAGWTSSGYSCGPSFFFEGMHQLEPLRVFGCLMQFLQHV